MTGRLKVGAALVLMAIPLPATAQETNPTPSAKAEFILEVAGFGDQLKLGARELRAATLTAVEKHNTRPLKISPKAAKRFAAIMEEEVTAARKKLRTAAAGYVLTQLTQAELDALYTFYSSTTGLSASTKLHWVSTHMWSELVPQFNVVLWPRIRDRLAQDPELRHTLTQ